MEQKFGFTLVGKLWNLLKIYLKDQYRLLCSKFIRFLSIKSCHWFEHKFYSKAKMFIWRNLAQKVYDYLLAVQIKDAKNSNSRMKQIYAIFSCWVAILTIKKTVKAKFCNSNLQIANWRTNYWNRNINNKIF